VVVEGRTDGNGDLIVVYGATGADDVTVMPNAKCNPKGCMEGGRERERENLFNGF